MNNKILFVIVLIAIGVAGYLFYTMQGSPLNLNSNLTEEKAINLVEQSGLEYLVDAGGFTLYYNGLNDEREDGTIAPSCDTLCEETYLPYLVEDAESLEKITNDPIMSKVNLYQREDGGWQYAIGTKLLYKYALDVEAGEINGLNDVEGWIPARP